MRWASGILGILLALYAGYQSILISQAGFNQQIPQLMGDGGGGILFAALTLLASVTCMMKPFLSAFGFLFCTLLSGLVAFLFNDPMILAWSLGATVLACFCFIAASKSRHHRSGIGR